MKDLLHKIIKSITCIENGKRKGLFPDDQLFGNNSFIIQI